MCIRDSNYPERLDAALTRPGRIDTKINFGRCTSRCLAQMYEHFFNDTEHASLWPKDFDKSTLPDGRWTPAETTQILLNSIHDPHQGLTRLVTEFPEKPKKS